MEVSLGGVVLIGPATIDYAIRSEVTSKKCVVIPLSKRSTNRHRRARKGLSALFYKIYYIKKL